MSISDVFSLGLGSCVHKDTRPNIKESRRQRRICGRTAVKNGIVICLEANNKPVDRITKCPLIGVTSRKHIKKPEQIDWVGKH